MYVFAAFSAGYRMIPHRPVRHACLYLRGGQPFVLAVVPLREFFGGFIYLQAGQLSGMRGTLAWAAQYQAGRHVGAPEMAQYQAGVPRLLFSPDSKRDVRATGMPA